MIPDSKFLRRSTDNHNIARGSKQRYKRSGKLSRFILTVSRSSSFDNENRRIVFFLLELTIGDSTFRTTITSSLIRILVGEPGGAKVPNLPIFSRS